MARQLTLELLPDTPDDSLSKCSENSSSLNSSSSGCSFFSSSTMGWTPRSCRWRGWGDLLLPSPSSSSSSSSSLSPPEFESLPALRSGFEISLASSSDSIELPSSELLLQLLLSLELPNDGEAQVGEEICQEFGKQV